MRIKLISLKLFNLNDIGSKIINYFLTIKVLIDTFFDVVFIAISSLPCK